MSRQHITWFTTIIFRKPLILDYGRMDIQTRPTARLDEFDLFDQLNSNPSSLQT
jgi:hypothetical protein